MRGPALLTRECVEHSESGRLLLILDREPLQRQRLSLDELTSDFQEGSGRLHLVGFGFERDEETDFGCETVTMCVRSLHCAVKQDNVYIRDMIGSSRAVVKSTTEAERTPWPVTPTREHWAFYTAQVVKCSVIIDRFLLMVLIHLPVSTQTFSSPPEILIPTLMKLQKSGAMAMNGRVPKMLCAQRLGGVRGLSEYVSNFPSSVMYCIY